MIRTRTRRLLPIAFAGLLTVGGVTACGDDDANNRGNNDGGIEEDLSNAGDDLSEGVDDVSEEIEDQVDEGSEENTEPEG